MVDHDKKSMTFAGDVPKGYLVQLMKAIRAPFIDGASQAAEAMEGTPAKVAGRRSVAISCAGRRLSGRPDGGGGRRSDAPEGSAGDRFTVWRDISVRDTGLRPAQPDHDAHGPVRVADAIAGRGRHAALGRRRAGRGLAGERDGEERPGPGRRCPP